MWPFKKEEMSIAVEEPTEVQTVVLEPVALPTSRPAREPRINSDEMQEYMKVAEDIGIDCCSDLTVERLLRCLREENIHIFNESQVVKYLDEKIGNDWEWCGLRTKDAKHLGGWFVEATSKHRKVFFSKEPYRAAVPLPVLLTVQKIQKAVPDDVYFFVSAPKDDGGDPFLCVTSRWMGLYIIERWDEPNFRER